MHTKSRTSARFCPFRDVYWLGWYRQRVRGNVAEDLRRRFAGLDPALADWRLDAETYTVEQAATRLRACLFEEKAAVSGAETNIQLRVCGYFSGRPLAEV